MAAKPSMRFIATTSPKLNTIEVKAGQLIFCSDTRAIYLDTDVRTPYQTILTVADEESRLAIISPFQGYYYVMSTNALWSYFGEWVQMTGEEPNVVFSDGELPLKGQEDVIYVKDDKMYRWDDTLHNYYQLSGGNSWEEYSIQSI